MVEIKQNIAARINKELEALLSTLNGNTSKIEEIITLFIKETPQLFKQIQQYINQEKWYNAAALVHKVKIRYGYLGLEDILTDLSHWEDNLTINAGSINNTLILDHFIKTNNDILRELKKLKFYHSPISKTIKCLPLLGKQVLIAEDDEVNAMVFDLFVKETGASTVIVTDGNAALKVVYDRMPDMIFMDVHMPFFSGLDAIKKLRENKITCPIVSLSASTRLNERQNSLDAGANDFLVKPANRESINMMMMKYLDR